MSIGFCRGSCQGWHVRASGGLMGREARPGALAGRPEIAYDFRPR
jgi:hypothetical protein